MLIRIVHFFYSPGTQILYHRFFSWSMKCGKMSKMGRTYSVANPWLNRTKKIYFIQIFQVAEEFCEKFMKDLLNSF